MPAQPVHDDRLHALDAVRAFALIVGVVFHAGFSFLPGMPPGIWAMVDASPSPAIAVLLFVSHIFRMTLFFFVAGFFARMLFHRRGAGAFWRDRLKRILVPFIVGWLVLAPTIGVVWIWGLKTTFGGALPTLPPNLPPPPPGAFPLTHLWFLYYLLILYVLVVTGRSLLSMLDRAGAIRRAADAAVGGLVRSGAAAFVLPLPLVAALVARPDWIMWFGIPTPDQSVIPQLASLLGYGTAVAFGWLVHRQTDVLQVWRRLWPVHLGLAMAASVACLAIGGVTPVLMPASRSAGTIAYAAGYGLAIWSWTFALIGMAMRWLSQPDARIRYVADASYWIYLVHLPLVVALQVIAGPLPLHWSLKFPVILVVAFAMLLASYRYLVRATFVGQTLNGRRLPRGLASTPLVPSPPSPGPRTGTDDATDATGGPGSPAVSTLAMLRGVHKRYGTTHALAGVDLAVRCGEVVALLGPNGAGKTTAIGLWLGLLDADEGQVTLAGGPPREIQARRRVGVMMQDVELTPELRVRDLVTLAASYYPNPRSLDRDAGHDEARGAGQSEVQRPLRRAEAARAVRDRDLRPADAALPRRADDRARHRSARDRLAHRASARRRRHRRRPHDALPGGGGGARGPRRRPRPRPPARLGQRERDPLARLAQADRVQDQPRRGGRARLARCARREPGRGAPADHRGRSGGRAPAPAGCRRRCHPDRGSPGGPRRCVCRADQRGCVMTTMTTRLAFVAPAEPSPPMSGRRVLGAYVREWWTEVLRALRTPGFSIPFLLMPTPIYFFFGVVLAGDAVTARPDSRGTCSLAGSCSPP